MAVYLVTGWVEITVRNGGFRQVKVIHEIEAADAATAAQSSLAEIERAQRRVAPTIDPQPTWVIGPDVEVAQ